MVKTVLERKRMKNKSIIVEDAHTKASYNQKSSKLLGQAVYQIDEIKEDEIFSLVSSQ
ncbi:hypothetical protein MKZ02_02855 [Pseudobacillus sp. FSL P4-0506]|uniref:hypothetical protein n=1 Tax=Pseudobacillus sp. FSL P4-0506 TaxID=2921576 RepID=UPI0030F545A1